MKNKSKIEFVKSLPKEVFEKYLYEDKFSCKKIGELFGVSESFMKRWVNSLGLKLNLDRFTEFNIHKFDVIDTEEKAYWLGFLYADGCIIETRYAVVLKLAKKDYNHIVKFKEFLEDKRTGNHIHQRKISPFNNGKEYEECSYIVYNKYFMNSLIKLGCTPRKTLTLEFPDENIFTKKDLVYDFIRGYVDGDGSISHNKNRLYLSILGTENFLKGIQKYFPQFPTIYKFNTRDNKALYMNISADNADQVAYRLYENATIYLDRKRDNYTALCRLHNSEKSDKIGESCDANAEVTPEIAKGSESTVENSE